MYFKLQDCGLLNYIYSSGMVPVACASELGNELAIYIENCKFLE
jgi:hypothetical protein